MLAPGTALLASQTSSRTGRPSTRQVRSPRVADVATRSYAEPVRFPRSALLSCAVIALTGCTSATPAVVPQAGALASGQKDLESQALAGLAVRSCDARPIGPDLQGLPGTALPCLGVGAARVVSQGDGRPSVVNLWASWCPPCLREMPLLEQVFQDSAGQVSFVGVNTEDERASAAGLLDFTGVTYEQREDPDGRVKAALRALGLPVTVVYDADGREVDRRFGEIKDGWLQDTLAKAGVQISATPSATPTPGTG